MGIRPLVLVTESAPEQLSPRYWNPLPRFRVKQSTCYHLKAWIGLLNYKALQAKVLIDMVLDFSLAY